MQLLNKVRAEHAKGLHICLTFKQKKKVVDKLSFEV